MASLGAFQVVVHNVDPSATRQEIMQLFNNNTVSATITAPDQHGASRAHVNFDTFDLVSQPEF